MSEFRFNVPPTIGHTDMGDQFNVSSKRHEKHCGKMKVDGQVSQHIVIIVT